MAETTAREVARAALTGAVGRRTTTRAHAVTVGPSCPGRFRAPSRVTRPGGTFAAVACLAMRDFVARHEEVLVALLGATIPLLLFWAKRLAYSVRGWLRANPEKRDALGMAFVILGVSGLWASGPLLHGWWEALFLNLGVSLVTVGAIEIVIMSAVEGNDGRQKL